MFLDDAECFIRLLGEEIGAAVIRMHFTVDRRAVAFFQIGKREVITAPKIEYLNGRWR